MCVFLFTKSAYQIVVEELHSHRTKREAGAMECYQVPVTYQNSLSGGAPYYFAAELPPGNLPEPAPFTVGDNRTYQGFWNPPLAPRKGYNIYFQAMSSVEKVSCLRDLLFHCPEEKPQSNFILGAICQKTNKQTKNMKGNKLVCRGFCFCSQQRAQFWAEAPCVTLHKTPVS